MSDAPTERIYPAARPAKPRSAVRSVAVFVLTTCVAGGVVYGFVALVRKPIAPPRPPTAEEETIASAKLHLACDMYLAFKDKSGFVRNLGEISNRHPRTKASYHAVSLRHHLANGQPAAFVAQLGKELADNDAAKTAPR